MSRFPHSKALFPPDAYPSLVDESEDAHSQKRERGLEHEEEIRELIDRFQDACRGVERLGGAPRHLLLIGNRGSLYRPCRFRAQAWEEAQIAVFGDGG